MLAISWEEQDIPIKIDFRDKTSNLQGSERIILRYVCYG